ncbi:MAG: hypothetical protein HZA24_12615 [Nitrospirae bacterium]|nr:hypothetical protein [Nitrospirota bacterium]
MSAALPHPNGPAILALIIALLLILLLPAHARAACGGTAPDGGARCRL